MASEHCTGNPRPVKIPIERQQTISTRFYKYPPRAHSKPRCTHRMPWLQIRSDRLSAADFDIYTPMRVRVMHGCLVLTMGELKEKTPLSL